MKEIGLSTILALILSGCSTTQQTPLANTQPPTPIQPLSVNYETRSPQEMVRYPQSIIHTPIIETPTAVIQYETIPLQETIVYTEANPIIQTPAPIIQQENISVTEAFSMIQNQDVTLLDVRTQPETITDRKIANSKLMPLQVLGSHIDQIDNSKPILVYCRSGNRSAIASEILRSQGFNAINVLGGINAWKANGLPVE